MPITPAASVITSASSKNCPRMCDFFAPSARRNPISLHPLFHRHQHDVHHANAADSQRQRANKNSSAWIPSVMPS